MMNTSTSGFQVNESLLKHAKHVVDLEQQVEHHMRLRLEESRTQNHLEQEKIILSPEELLRVNEMVADSSSLLNTDVQSILDCRKPSAKEQAHWLQVIAFVRYVVFKNLGKTNQHSRSNMYIYIYLAHPQNV